MALRWFLIFNFISSTLFLINVIPSSAQDARKAYIVYMGKKPEIGESEIPNFHVKILRDVVDNNNDIAHEDLLLHSYKRSFHGFSANLTEQEAQKLAEMEGVVSVFPDKETMLKTTHSWDFVGFPETYKRSNLESDVIIGVFDSGIWPELDVFSDDGLGPPPTKWKGICQFDNFTCNNKIIGARYYYSGADKEIIKDKETQLARDYDHHGTHCASSAAGRMVSSASVQGLGLGTARGGLPSARIAVYKICWRNGCGQTQFLAAVDDAIADGVDIISASTGGEPTDYRMDGLTIEAFHATVNGILVSMAAGNEGPSKKTVKNNSPWQLSVASTTTDRKFITKIKLGNGKVYEGDNLNLKDMGGEFHPLMYGGDAPSKKINAPKWKARFCTKDSLDEDLVKDKIVLCDNKGPKGSDLGTGSGALGLILTGKNVVDEPERRGQRLLSAAVFVSLEDNTNIYKYIDETRENATATILKSEEVKDVLAPLVFPSSSRGPNPLTPSILKPDIAAPGFNILAGCPPKTCGEAQYQFLTGTSMACPHVTAVAAYVKSFHPKWSPTAIKSAIMTTATPMSPKKIPLAEFSYGAGLINPSKAPYPGLVYDLTVQDYIDFLCVLGYNQKQLDLITENETMTTPCSSESKNETINNFNNPAIALLIEDPEDFNGVFHRIVTNVGSPNSIYKAKVVTSSGLKVDVHPNVLSFTSLEEKKSFVVTIKGPIEQSNIVSASLVWDDGVFQVRSPIVVYF